MPENLVRSRRSIAVAVAVAVLVVPVAVLLSVPTPAARAAAAPGSTVRASVVDGTDAQVDEGGWDQELSGDGNSVVFTSDAQLDDLETAGNANVFVRDLRANRTVQISRGQFTWPEPPEEPEIPEVPEVPEPPTFTPPKLGGDKLLSLNGRRAQPTGEPDVEWGEVAATGSSGFGTISEDGRYVAFTTTADNITTDDPDTAIDLLVCDRDPDNDGELDEEREDGSLVYEYFRVSQPEWESGEGGWFRVDSPQRPRISADGGRLVWRDLTRDAQGLDHQVVKTASLVPPLVPPEGSAPGLPGNAEVLSLMIYGGEPTELLGGPDLSADGRYVVAVGRYIRYEGPNEFPVQIPYTAVVRVDLDTGTVLRVDWDEATTPEEPVYLSWDRTVQLSDATISGDGSQIAFVADAWANFCEPYQCWYSAADQPQVYLVRVAEDGTPLSSEIASRGNEHQVVNGVLPALSADGRFLAFVTDNLNAHDGVDVEGGDSCIVPDDDGGGDDVPASTPTIAALPPYDELRDERTFCQVVVRDLVVDRERLTTEQPWLPGTLASPGSSEDCAEEIPEGGTCAGNENTLPDVYNRRPSLSHDGSAIGYKSDATDLVLDDPDENEIGDVFVRTFRPELRPVPDPMDFGEVTLTNTFDQTVRLDHVGTGPLVVTEIEVLGTNADDFVVGAQTCEGEAVVLQQTDSCEVSVAFTPSAEGDRTATLLLRTRDGREFTVELVGRGTKVRVINPNARFAATPDPLAFGQRLLQSTGPESTVTVRNTGAAELRITTVEIVSAAAPNDYAISANTCTTAPIPGGGQCQVTVRFIPTASGDRTAVLRFVDNAPGGPHLVGLGGVGSTPTIALSPAVTQPARVLTVTGQGFTPLQDVTITMPGTPNTVTVTTNADGTFTKGLLILPKSPIGTRPVVATVNAFPLITAQKPVLVVTPSVSPADFVIRG